MGKVAMIKITPVFLAVLFSPQANNNLPTSQNILSTSQEHHSLRLVVSFSW